MARRKLTRRHKTRLVYVPQTKRHADKAAYKVPTFEDIYTLLAQLLAGQDITDSNIFDGRFNVSIHITGERWSRNIDYRTALFILRLQREINLIYSRNTDKKVTLKNLYPQNKELILKVRIDDGSQDVLIYVEKCLKHIAKMVEGMESKHKRDVLIAFAAAAGLSICLSLGSCQYFASKSEEFQQNIRLAEIERDKLYITQNEQTQRELQNILLESSKGTIKIAESVVELARKMQPDDRMDIGAHNFTRQEAITAFGGAEEPDIDEVEVSKYIDGKYDITNVNLENGTITIKKDGKSYKVLTRYLEDSQKRRLHKLYQDSQLMNTYPKAIPLQINAAFKDGQWDGGMVIGLGKPRKGSISIREALKLSEPRKRPRQEQASLLDEE